MLAHLFHACHLTDTPTTAPIQDKDPRSQLRQQRWIWAPAPQGPGPASLLHLQPPASSARETAHAPDHSLDPLDYITSANPCSSFYDLVLSPVFVTSCPIPSLDRQGEPHLCRGLVWFEQVQLILYILAQELRGPIVFIQPTLESKVQ